MTEQPIGVCAIVLNERGECVLGKRKNSYKAGMYGLPGGRVAVGEPLARAIAREVFEETGMTGFDFQFVEVVRETQDGKDAQGDQISYDFVHFVSSAKAGAQQPQLIEPDKCEGWEWRAVGVGTSESDLQEVLPGHAAAISLFVRGEGVGDLTSVRKELKL